MAAMQQRFLQNLVEAIRALPPVADVKNLVFWRVAVGEPYPALSQSLQLRLQIG
jgi:hypothetical protein